MAITPLHESLAPIPESGGKRLWRLLQVESALACNLRCVTCPWKDFRERTKYSGVMQPEIWAAIRPHLSQVKSADFTGGGEALLQPKLAPWISEANAAVCEQDPRDSAFISYKGVVAPCINLALAGRTTFLAQDVTLSEVHYGTLPQDDLADVWETHLCAFYRTRFDERARAYNEAFMQSLMSDSRLTPERLREAAVKRMPEAPEGCKVCHYLYDI